MKIYQNNESNEQKKSRLARCVNIIKNIDAGEKSEFNPLVGLDTDPRMIGFNKAEQEENDMDITHELIVLKEGRNKIENEF